MSRIIHHATFMKQLGFALCVGAAAASVGCNTPPQGRGHGRADPGEVTRAEENSGQIYLADMREASDRMVDSLIKDLSDLQQNELRQGAGDYESTLVFGDIANKSRSMPTTDFEYVRERMRDMMLSSREFRKSFRVVESRARYESVRAREEGSADPLQRSSGITSDRTLNPAYTYYLNGNTFQLDRGDTRGYYFNFQLMRASDSEIVWSHQYEVTYR